MGKFVRWDLIDGRLSWSFDQDKIVAEKLFDGCYIVSGEVPKEKMAASEVVASKKLSLVEEPSAASRLCNSKYGPSTTRPMIESEVTSSCVRWPITCSGISSSGLNLYSPPTAPTKIDNGQCATVIERLAAIRRDKIAMGSVEFEKVTTPEPDQQTILDYLKVRL